MEFIKLVNEFIDVIDDIYGLYLDAGHGFVLNKYEMINRQKNTLEQKGLTIEEQDEKEIKYAVGLTNANNISLDNYKTATYELHKTTQKSYKLRNTRNGSNYKKLANLCLVQIYGYWNDHYRGSIAKSVNLQSNDINSDIIGDIRYLREAIVHHRGIATKDIKKTKLIKKFNPNDKIELDEYQIESIIELLKKDMLNLLNNLSDKFDKTN